MTGEVTAAIADFVATVSFDDVPTGVIDRAKIHVLDTLGLAIAGSRSDAARIARDHVAALGADGSGSAVFGTDLRVPARFAAFANAAAMHADNFDDTTPQIRPDRTGGIHASGAILPTILALAEGTGASGRDIIGAYLVGVEVSSRLNHAIAARHYADGFHTTGTLNVFGAACAACRLAGVDADTVAHAVGIAASRASGVRRNFGAMAEILHSAHAAEDGIVAADLAARGLTAAGDALDGPTGFFAAAAGGCDASEIVGRLGTPWVFENPGVWIKPHPNGALTHPGAGCLLDLLRDKDISADDIERIDVRTNRRVWNTLQHHDPKDGMQAKFSMEFTLAVIAGEGRAGLAEFTTDTLLRPDIQGMMSRIRYTPYEDAEDGYTNVTTLLNVVEKDGRSFAARADHARGSTKAPMDFDAVADKFRQCAAYGNLPAEDAAALVGCVRDLDAENEPEKLFRLLAGQASKIA